MKKEMRGSKLKTKIQNLSKRTKTVIVVIAVLLMAGIVALIVVLCQPKNEEINETKEVAAEIEEEEEEKEEIEEEEEVSELVPVGISAEMLAAIQDAPYYMSKNLGRYTAYSLANPELSARDVVRNVNSNLDHTRYVDVKNADLSYGVLSMINKYNYLGDYEPSDLEHLGDGYTNSTAPMLRHEAAVAFREMADAARAEGLSLINISGYRSYSLQNWLYEAYAARDGYALADTYSSRPGYSEHQAGLATDINTVEESFENTAEFAWLQKHAADYGFIMRYPKGLAYITGFDYEPWHYRYVGVEAAQQIVREGLTFDEYYGYYVEK